MTDAFTEFTPAPENRGIVVALWTRRALMTLIALVVAAALANGFGQRESSTTAIGPSASLEMTAPRTVRGGLFFQARVIVRATSDLSSPRLILDTGWTEGLQVNSIEPQATSESNRNGRVLLSYDPVAKGEVLRVWFEFEVNPTNLGSHPFGMELDDGTTPVARVERTLTALP